MSYIDATLGVNESSDDIMLRGQCDVWVSGITTGQVVLQVRFPGSTTWRDVPEGTFSSEAMKSISVTEDQVHFRFLGIGNNAGVYVRLAN